MKYPVFATLLAVLLAGCADTPTQDASIEDRALASKDAKKSADAKAAAATATEKAAAPQAADSAKVAAKPACLNRLCDEVSGLILAEITVGLAITGAHAIPPLVPNRRWCIRHR